MARFEELDWRSTPLGEISLRRRVEPALHVDVYEVKLGDDFLMSSLFTVAEVELARLGLAAATGSDLDVVVGGLGLGWTARAALEDGRVRSLHVVEALEAVIGWHERGLLPGAAQLTADPRTRLVHGDFFAEVGRGAPGLPAPDLPAPDLPAPGLPGLGLPGLGLPARWHAVLVDIDHTPTHLLAPAHAGFYTAPGLRRLADRLNPGGVFALWSDAPPDDAFRTLLREVFVDSAAHVVTFPNHLTGGESANTVYTAIRRPG